MPADFTPANELEKALVLAAQDPAARPAFLRCLLEADLFFLTPQPPAAVGKRVLEQGQKVELVAFGRPRGPFTPFFSSRARVEEVAHQMQRPFGFLALAGR